MKILLLEDNHHTAEQLTEALTNQHYIVDVATDGQAGWELVEAYPYDLVLLNVVLPKLDGINFCHKLRQKRYQMSAILLTDRYVMREKIKGLDAGADAYIAKPLKLPELMAQIRCLLRRSSQMFPPILSWEGLCLDSGTCSTYFENWPLKLTPKQFRLLELFLRCNSRVLTPSTILDHLWSFEDPPGEDAVKALIKRLRQKLESVGAPSDLIRTIYGLGYHLKPTNNGYPPPVSVVDTF